MIYDTRDTFDIAQEVYEVLEQEETDLLVQLHGSLCRGTAFVDPTMFSAEIVTEDEDDKNDFWRRFLRSKRVEEHDEEYFADLRIFFRKWVSEAFMECLSANGAAMVWDYLFLRRFAPPEAVNVCLAVFSLLQPTLKTAETFSQVSSVMMEGPRSLYTLDLRRVLRHFARGGGYGDIPPPPDVPAVQITPPSANPDDRKSMERRIEALNMDFLEAE